MRTKITGGKAENVIVDYRMRRNDGEWLIIDVKAEGISLVLNLREQFQAVMNNGGPEKLLKVLREKTSEL